MSDNEETSKIVEKKIAFLVCNTGQLAKSRLPVQVSDPIVEHLRRFLGSAFSRDACWAMITESQDLIELLTKVAGILNMVEPSANNSLALDRIVNPNELRFIEDGRWYDHLQTTVKATKDIILNSNIREFTVKLNEEHFRISKTELFTKYINFISVKKYFCNLKEKLETSVQAHEQISGHQQDEPASRPEDQQAMPDGKTGKENGTTGNSQPVISGGCQETFNHVAEKVRVTGPMIQQLMTNSTLFLWPALMGILLSNLKNALHSPKSRSRSRSKSKRKGHRSSER